MSRIPRRGFLAGVVVVPFAAQAWVAEAASERKGQLILVGTGGGASKGIYAYEWQAASGELTLLGLAAETKSPTFLALAPKAHSGGAERVYAAGEAVGMVSGFTLDRATSKLTLINSMSSNGAGPCHLTLDATGQALFVANYDSGGIASFKVGADGSLSKLVSSFDYTGHGPNPKRQEKTHMHRVTLSPDNRFLLTNDLGLDAIRIYSVDADSAKIVPYHPAQWNATPGAGPRSLRFHPTRPDLAYLVNELDSTAEVLAWDRLAGTLTSLQRLKFLPQGYSGPTTGCESAISSDGAFAYFANRYYDCIVTCTIDATTGKLTTLGRSATGGRIARHIALDPAGRWLLIANQESNNIAVFARNPKTGMLGETAAHSYPLDSPQCLLFV